MSKNKSKQEAPDVETEFLDWLYQEQQTESEILEGIIFEMENQGESR